MTGDQDSGEVVLLGQGGRMWEVFMTPSIEMKIRGWV